MKRIFLLSLFSLLIVAVQSQEACNVLVPNLKGQYTGDCKKGLADGNGVAVGTDSYQGEFKKGLPNGYGVYTYENGIRYIGNFKAGLKDGYGFTVSSGEAKYNLINYGFWFADSLITPYDVRALMRVDAKKGITVISPEVNMDDILKDQVWIHFMKNGAPDYSVTVESIILSSGKVIDVSERSLNTIVYMEDFSTFPVTIELVYTIQKDNSVSLTECKAKVVLMVPGLWDLYFHH